MEQQAIEEGGEAGRPCASRRERRSLYIFILDNGEHSARAEDLAVGFTRMDAAKAALRSVVLGRDGSESQESQLLALRSVANEPIQVGIVASVRDRAAVVLPPTSSADAFKEALRSLPSGGVFDFPAALKLAAFLAARGQPRSTRVIAFVGGPVQLTPRDADDVRSRLEQAPLVSISVACLADPSELGSALPQLERLAGAQELRFVHRADASAHHEIESWAVTEAVLEAMAMPTLAAAKAPPQPASSASRRSETVPRRTPTGTHRPPAPAAPSAPSLAGQARANQQRPAAAMMGPLRRDAFSCRGSSLDSLLHHSRTGMLRPFMHNYSTLAARQARAKQPAAAPECYIKIMPQVRYRTLLRFSARDVKSHAPPAVGASLAGGPSFPAARTSLGTVRVLQDLRSPGNLVLTWQRAKPAAQEASSEPSSSTSSSAAETASEETVPPHTNTDTTTAANILEPLDMWPASRRPPGSINLLPNPPSAPPSSSSPPGLSAADAAIWSSWQDPANPVVIHNGTEYWLTSIQSPFGCARPLPADCEVRVWSSGSEGRLIGLSTVAAQEGRAKRAGYVFWMPHDVKVASFEAVRMEAALRLLARPALERQEQLAARLPKRMMGVEPGKIVQPGWLPASSAAAPTAAPPNKKAPTDAFAAWVQNRGLATRVAVVSVLVVALLVLLVWNLLAGAVQAVRSYGVQRKIGRNAAAAPADDDAVVAAGSSQAAHQQQPQSTHTADSEPARAAPVPPSSASPEAASLASVMAIDAAAAEASAADEPFPPVPTAEDELSTWEASFRLASPQQAEAMLRGVLGRAVPAPSHEAVLRELLEASLIKPLLTLGPMEPAIAAHLTKQQSVWEMHTLRAAAAWAASRSAAGAGQRADSAAAATPAAVPPPAPPRDEKKAPEGPR